MCESVANRRTKEATGSLKQSPSSETETEAHFAILQHFASVSCSKQPAIFTNHDHNNSVHALLYLIISDFLILSSCVYMFHLVS